MLHFDGHAVTTVPTGVSVDLADTWGMAPDDLWAVGGSGTALQPVDSLGSFAFGPHDVWLVGALGTWQHSTQ